MQGLTHLNAGIYNRKEINAGALFKEIIISKHNLSARNKDQKLVGRFLKIGYFIGYYTAVPLKMYGKYG